MVFPSGGDVPVRGDEREANYPPIGYVGAIPTPVPTMSVYGLGLTTLGLLLLATRRLSRRKVKDG